MRSRCGIQGRKRLIIARDRFGEKPLYYGIFDGKLIYASEPKALLAHPSVRPELDLDALRHYLSFDYVPAPMSIYKGIHKLPAAHILTVENGEVRTRRYWDISWSRRLPSLRRRGVRRFGRTGWFSRPGAPEIERLKQLISRKDANRKDETFGSKADELRDLLSDAVRMRLVADVPLGILLSGGIDSSTVAAFATAARDRKGKNVFDRL